HDVIRMRQLFTYRSVMLRAYGLYDTERLAVVCP
ncbi:hypothetical protein PPOP_2173, partial [Paenibacillus popilliae ATCC 14706]